MFSVFDMNFSLRAQNPGNGFENLMRGLGYSEKGGNILNLGGGNNAFGTAAFRLQASADPDAAAQFFGIDKKRWLAEVRMHGDTPQGRLDAFEAMNQKLKGRTFDYSILKRPHFIEEMQYRVRANLDGNVFGGEQRRAATVEALSKLRTALEQRPQLNLRIQNR
jgi:hypothetical protein